VFVVVADVMQFMVGLGQHIKFFVTYEVKFEAATVKLTLDAGELEIDFQVICGAESEIFGKKSEGELTEVLITIPRLIGFISLQGPACHHISTNDVSAVGKV